MSSPFPGMDPYLERHWRDVHTKLITYASDELNNRLPDNLIARAEERLAVEIELPNDDGTSYRRSVSPDVRVFAVIENVGAQAAAEGGVALAPYRLSTIDEPETDRYIEIIDVSGGERVITVVEFVSPTNKSDGLQAFLDKRHELLAGGVNVVEIDLVREGNWHKLVTNPYPPKADSAYRAVMRVAGNPPDVWMHPFSIRERLPAIKIPLRPKESPCELHLQPLIDQAYRNGRYGRTIDYRRPCEPPLEGDDAVWADELLRDSARIKPPA
jgi:hypothetical protein